MNLKLEEICSKIEKEVVNLDHSYSALNTKLDIVVADVMKIVEFHNSLLTKTDTKLEFDSKAFPNLRS